MKVSEFLKVTAQPNQWFCIKKVGEMVNDDEEEIIDKDELEFSEFENCEIKQIDFILDFEKSCRYSINIVVVLFIETEVEKFCNDFIKS